MLFPTLLSHRIQFRVALGFNELTSDCRPARIRRAGRQSRQWRKVLIADLIDSDLIELVSDSSS